MLKFAVAILFSIVAGPAFALQCPAFPYDLSEEKGVRELRSFRIDESTSLTALQAKQVLATAEWSAKYNGVPAPTTSAEAVKFLAEGSEGGDIYYLVFRFDSKLYVRVTSYPGGNPYGLVFSGETAIATVQDGDVDCL
jgi:hypothetical protein